ncbi:MAG TPA: hypothetical protein VJZ71_13210 [Phycisphaerae bacterium]|nr:hypothetical protein [Phycisphaerae bacterium]
MSNSVRTQEETFLPSEEPSASPAPQRDTARQENTRSSLFEKIPPDLRHALDVAIAEHVPPTFRAVWMQFELAKFGVSFAAFYRYARRVRERVNLVEAASLAGEDDADVDAVLKKLTGRRALDLLLHTNSSECLKEIATLVSAHSQAAWLDIAERRIALGRRRLDEESDVARARLELDREQLRLKSQLLQSARSVRPLSKDAEPLRLAKLDEPDADVATAKPVTEKCGTNG